MRKPSPEVYVFRVMVPARLICEVVLTDCGSVAGGVRQICERLEECDDFPWDVLDWGKGDAVEVEVLVQPSQPALPL